MKTTTSRTKLDNSVHNIDINYMHYAVTCTKFTCMHKCDVRVHVKSERERERKSGYDDDDAILRIINIH